MLKILVIEHAHTPILGRDFLKIFHKKITVYSIFDKHCNLEKLNKAYEEILDSKIDKLKNVKMMLEVQENIVPKFFKARSVPYTFKKDIESQLTLLSEQGIITKIENPEWGTPSVPILKDDGKVRICADYKVTLNKYLKDNNYPLPRISDILTIVSDGKIFSKIDLASAYNQLELDEESKNYTFCSTHIGNFTMNRLPFGFKPATGIFQFEIDKIIKGNPGVVVFLDDILVSAPDIKTHNERLEILLKRFRSAGMSINLKKTWFAEKMNACLDNPRKFWSYIKFAVFNKKDYCGNIVVEENNVLITKDYLISQEFKYYFVSIPKRVVENIFHHRLYQVNYTLII